MGRRKKGARVLGPYRIERRGTTVYRVIQVDEDGTRAAFEAATEASARTLIRACHIDLGIALSDELSVTGAMDAFIDQKRRTQAWSERTFERTGADLRFFADAQPNAPIGIVNPEWIRSYLQRISHLALATQQSRYHAVVEFLGWCVRKGHLKANPCDMIDRSEKPWVGKRARRRMGRGKPQLRNAAEVAAFLAEAAKLGKPHERVAVQLPLLCGLRSGAVRHLRVGDIDFGTGKIWIRDVEDDDKLDLDWSVKTAAGRRTVDIPPELSEDLTQLIAGRDPAELLMSSNRNPGKPWDRKWLNRRVKLVCEAAGTRVICTHGLRDTYSSMLSALAGLSPVHIARLMGHADQGQTAQRHYIGVPEHKPVLRLVN